MQINPNECFIAVFCSIGSSIGECAKKSGERLVKLPSLFLAALGQQAVPRPQFDLDEVLNFHQRHPVASLPKYG